jgi:hypothetical protein
MDLKAQQTHQKVGKGSTCIYPGASGSYLWEAVVRRIMVWGQPGQKKSKNLSQKYPAQKRAVRVAQVVKHLPSKHEALSSNSNTAKKKKMHLI